MDISSIIETGSIEYDLLHPVNKTPTGIVFVLAGPEHSARKGYALKQARELRKVVNRTGKVTLGDPAEDEEKITDYLVVCTLGWRNLEISGKEIPYSAEFARELYTTQSFAWLRRQVRAALDDLENFIQS